MLLYLVNKINPFYVANYRYNVIFLLNSPVGRILQRLRCSCFKRYNFWNFTVFLLGHIEENSCNLWNFPAIFMKSHIMIVKTLSEHIIMVILHFSVKKCVCVFFNKTSFFSQNYRSFAETAVMGIFNIF